MKNVILVIDDDELMLEQLVRQFIRRLPNVQLLCAKSSKEAREIFEAKKKEIAVVYMDGDLNEDIEKPDTKALAESFLKDNDFSGEIYATSSNDDYKNKLMEIGCTEKCEKFEIFEKARSLFV